jgi:ribosomal protein S18 acetylase RimI-like enzyme
LVAAVREATLGDALAIAKVQVGTWKTAYMEIVPDGYLEGLSIQRGEEHWLEWLQERAGNGGVFVAVEDDRVVGFASCGTERTGDPVFRGEVYAIYVLPESQRRGVGRLLMASAAVHLKDKGFRSMLLWVLRDNPSRGFYERLGGERLREQEIEIGGKKLIEVAYGWRELGSLATPDAPRSPLTLF